MKHSLSAISVALLFCACSSVPRGTPPRVALGPARDTAPQKAATLVAGRRGEFVALAAKGTLTLEIQANTQAGYRWKLAEPVNPSVLEVVPPPKVALEPVALPPNGVSQPEKEMWTFKAVGPGTVKVRMIYSNPNLPLSQTTAYDFTVNAE